MPNSEDFVLNYDDRKKSRIPTMTPTKHVVTNKKNEEHPFYLNEPSTILTHLMANPSKNPMLSNFLDETKGSMSCMQQGEKWRTHPMFQNPMVTLPDKKDVWVGDLLKLYDGRIVIVDRFFKERVITSSEHHNELFASCYEVSNPPFPCFALSVLDFPLSDLSNAQKLLKSDYVTDRGFGWVIPGIEGIFDLQDAPENESRRLVSLWKDGGFRQDWKRPKSDGSLMKVVVAPLMLFSDDTSGNLSKQYNLFDSFLMIPVAMSYNARFSKNNNFFMCTSNKKLTSMDMLLPIVDDLLRLEKGVPMFSIIRSSPLP
ncbi:unnamed protein product [Mucor hiemalis]